MTLCALPSERATINPTPLGPRYLDVMCTIVSALYGQEDIIMSVEKYVRGQCDLCTFPIVLFHQ